MEFNTPKALPVESTVNAFTAITTTTTAVPHTLAPLTAPLTANNPEKSTKSTVDAPETLPVKSTTL
jgi:hypothetical protein